MSEPELTKREFAAIQIMAGFASDPTCTGPIGLQAEAAIKWADELLKQLQETDQ